MSRQAYDIAGHRIVVEFAGAYGHAEIIAPTFQPFAVAEDNGREAILLIKADDSYRPDKNDLLKAGDYYSANTEYSMYSRSNGNIVIFFGIGVANCRAAVRRSVVHQNNFNIFFIII